ncbi:LacI family DNA-binding transcriptional regulator [Deinococcus petrolearius]|uniref:LacI family DNA-binding transcriptional regulator n=1 Tax=Deinococcus petrolearius TaxID=1751295 RepID=A0ABW1DEP0_9DEIO
MSQNVTIHDVAQQSGVSYQTVSRVINDHPSVAAKTRARVQEAISQLNYRPSLLAKSLSTRRSMLLGVVAYGTEQYGPSQLVQNVERSARAHDYEVLLVTLREFEEEALLAAVARLGQFGVDGLVLLAPYDAHAVVRGLGTQVPFILVDATEDVDGTTVSIDQAGGAAIATEHLIGLGHRAILHISGPREWSDAELRYQGYVQTMTRRGLTPLARVEGDWSPASGFAAARRALGSGVAFTALTVGNDQMALGAIAALRAAGLSVPGDVSVVGFDDIPEAAYFDPPLTTVAQDFGLLGRKSLEELLRRIAEPASRGRHVIFQPQLILRGSTRPVPEPEPEHPAPGS